MSFSCLESEKVGFLVVNEKENYDTAAGACIDFGGLLAHIDNLEQFDFLSEQLDAEADDPSQGLWIGYRDRLEVGGASPRRFLPEGGEGNVDFYESPGVFPWHSTQPNGGSNEDAQDCVAWIVSGNLVNEPARHEWFDTGCLDIRAFVCQRECGTDAPTKSPSSSPTILPIENDEPSIIWFLDYDLTHSIALLGIVVSAFLLIVAILMHRRESNKLSRLERSNVMIQKPDLRDYVNSDLETLEYIKAISGESSDTYKEYAKSLKKPA